MEVQWIRNHLPMQRTWVQSLVREDSICRSKACVPQLLSHRPRAHEPQLLKPMCLEPVLCNKRSPHKEKPVHSNEEHPRLAATRESPHTATKDLAQTKNKENDTQTSHVGAQTG